MTDTTQSLVFNSKESIMTTTPFRRKLELLLERLRPYFKKQETTMYDHVDCLNLSIMMTIRSLILSLVMMHLPRGPA